tara:strand:+ start:2142 stop:2639 length:498 start_codon:yes stop_codon:yes gene_type:complete
MEANAVLNSSPMTFSMIKTSLSNWWKSRAYKHKGAETLLYFMFLSGLLIWDLVGLQWEIKRVLIFAHLIVGLLVFPFIILPFWLSHRALLLRTKKPLFIRTGQAIELILSVCVLSGVYLVFWGAPGNTLGWLMQSAHFYSSCLLAPLIFYHALRWSVLNIKRFMT